MGTAHTAAFLDPGFVGPLTEKQSVAKNEHDYGGVFDDLLEATHAVRELRAGVATGAVSAASLDRAIKRLEASRAALQPLLDRSATAQDTLAQDARSTARGADRLILESRALSRSTHAAEEANVNVSAHDPTKLQANVMARHPEAYCAMSGAADPVNCGFTHDQREAVRISTRGRIDTLREVWSLAVAAVGIEDRLKTEKDPVPFLARMVVDVFFAMAGAGIGRGLTSGMKAAAAGAERLADQIAEKVADKGIQEVAKLPVKGRPLYVRPSMPSDRDGYIAALKAQPLAWSNNLHAAVDTGTDAVLDSIDGDLPTLDKISQSKLEGSIREQLATYDRQITRIDGVRHAARVFGPDGRQRMALIEPATESVPLSGSREFRDGTPGRTGRFRFVDWIHESLTARAWQRTMTPEGFARPAAKLHELFISSEDTTFWAEESLARVRAEIDYGSMQP